MEHFGHTTNLLLSKSLVRDFEFEKNYYSPLRRWSHSLNTFSMIPRRATIQPTPGYKDFPVNDIIIRNYHFDPSHAANFTGREK